mgnify:CR=1 FL=1|jgi:hypothetical protein
MKRILIILFLAFAATSAASAQGFAKGGTGEVTNVPRSMGFRIGVTGFDVTYQHSFRKTQFLQGDFGVDFGYSVNGHPGARATATYNFIWARPAWTHRGFWALYSGPGISLGYVNDMAHYKTGEYVAYTPKTMGDNGFMLGVAVQVGLEYTFDFPLTLAVELRPVFGMHVNDGVELGGVHYGSKVGFYDNGMMGFIPTFAARYRF